MTTSHSRFGPCIQRRVMQLIPILLLIALFGPPLFREVPSFPRSGNRKLASESVAALSADKRQFSLWKRQGGKQPLDGYLQERCAPLRQVYDQLLDPMFSLWNQTGFPVQLLENTSGDRVYVRNGKLAMSESTAWGRLIPTFINYIQHIAQLVHLPDMLLPLNPADEPLALIKPDEDARPLLAFCKTPGFSDVLIPNTLEGDVYKTSPEKRGDRVNIISGPHDTRKPMVVWRGTTGGFGGLRKGRKILLQLGLDRPDLVDSGVSDWNEELWGPEQGRKKPVMKMREQVKTYKYQAWLPGNCASVRLALQLAADAAVFKIENDETEWYYPLLKPYVHYIPITANETHTDLIQQLAWAESHKEHVRRIVRAANEFASIHLSGHGRDCYFMQLLSRYHHSTVDKLQVPKTAKQLPKYKKWV